MFTCRKCQKTFKKKDRLKTHKKFHTQTKLRNIGCPHCQYFFLTQGDLTRHVNNYHHPQPNKPPLTVASYPIRPNKLLTPKYPTYMPPAREDSGEQPPTKRQKRTPSIQPPVLTQLHNITPSNSRTLPRRPIPLTTIKPKPIEPPQQSLPSTELTHMPGLVSNHQGTLYPPILSNPELQTNFQAPPGVPFYHLIPTPKYSARMLSASNKRSQKNSGEQPPTKRQKRTPSTQPPVLTQLHDITPSNSGTLQQQAIPLTTIKPKPIEPPQQLLTPIQLAHTPSQLITVPNHRGVLCPPIPPNPELQTDFRAPSGVPFYHPINCVNEQASPIPVFDPNALYLPPPPPAYNQATNLMFDSDNDD